MSITVISGKPGSGKTATAVDMLIHWNEKNRPIFVDERLNERTGKLESAIPDLGVKHQVLGDARKWYEPGQLPDGAIIVIDECQKLWRVRPSGSAVPRDVAEFETHRHRGFDFLLVTQAPNLIDQNIRGLVSRHIHIRDMGAFGRRWNEWFEEVGDINSRSGLKSAPIQKGYKLPKRTFGLYRSASMHVKPVRSFPRVLFTLAIAVLALSWLIWMAYKSVQKKASPDSDKSVPALSSPSIPHERPNRPELNTSSGRRPTALQVVAPVANREPYAGFGVHLAASYLMDGKTRTFFTITLDGRSVGTVSDREMERAGYGWRTYGAPCFGVLIFREKERPVLCDAPVARTVQPAPPAPAASGPSA